MYAQANQSINDHAMRTTSLPQALRDTPPVAAELNDLSMALSRLQETAMALETQLEPVKNMGRIPPSATGKGEAIASICPMGQRIRELTACANSIQTQLATLRDAIEV